MDKAEALEILDPYLERIKKCVENGFNAYYVDYKSFLYRHSAISRACLIRDSILDLVRREFSDEPGIRLVETKNQLVVLEIKRTLLVRFKKLNARRCSSNIPTTQAIGYLRQTNIWGLPECVNLNAGYIPNREWTEISGIYVAKPIGVKINSWAIPLHDQPGYQPLLLVTPLKEEKSDRARLKDSSKNGRAGDERDNS